MRPDTWQDVRRLLVIQAGDAATVRSAEPVLRALRAALPRVAITLLTSPAAAEAGARLTGVDDVLAWDVVWQPGPRPGAARGSAARERALIAALRARQFDAAIILPAGGRPRGTLSLSPHPAAYACYLAGIPIRLGQSREFGGAVLQPAVQARAGAEGGDGLALLRAAGLAPATDAVVEGDHR